MRLEGDLLLTFSYYERSDRWTAAEVGGEGRGHNREGWLGRSYGHPWAMANHTMALARRRESTQGDLTNCFFFSCAALLKGHSSNSHLLQPVV